jgi:hypothetical protein
VNGAEIALRTINMQIISLSESALSVEREARERLAAGRDERQRREESPTKKSN